jgi:hypothetical protein
VLLIVVICNQIMNKYNNKSLLFLNEFDSETII